MTTVDPTAAAEPRPPPVLGASLVDPPADEATAEAFLAFAVHELQEPLRVVSGFLALLDRASGEALDDRARGYLLEAQQGATRAQHMVRDLLSYARAGASTLERSPVRMSDVLDSALADLAAGIEARHAEVTHDELPRVMGDADLLRQVLVNLVGSAIKFTDKGPASVHVGAKAIDEGHEIVVSDHGVGIPPEAHERLFELFYRAHGARFAGSGVGLAICERIIQAHGGRIWIESEPGEGTAVHFTLPGAMP